MTEEILNFYELISVRHDFLTGYFGLFKNTEKMNTLFKKSKDYKKVFTSSTHYCFDETNFHFEEFTEGVHYSKIQSEIESMTHVAKRWAETELIRAHFDFLVIEGNPGKLKWEDGKLIYRNQFEVMLYHLIKFKKIYEPSQIPKDIPNRFYICSSRIYF